MASKLGAPYGGRLVDAVLPLATADKLREQAKEFPHLALDKDTVMDLELVATGALSPLDGFMLQGDLLSVLKDTRLENGLLWSIPLILDVDGSPPVREGEELLLTNQKGEPRALLKVEEKYPYDKFQLAERVYGTTDLDHPGVRRTMERQDYLVGGPIQLLEIPRWGDLAPYRLTPAEARESFRAKGWKTVVGFQTRNPVHRGHEYIQKCALEVVDGLFIHPLVGWKKEDDLPNHLLLKSYELAITNYYPLERVILAGFPSRMHYAGPKEALYHAICRKNYGCTHFIVGRDHAAVGKYYGPYDAQKLLREYEDELGIVPLAFHAAFWCRVCYGIVTEKTCPHSENARINPSGTLVRDALKKGTWIPEEIMRPEIAELLKEG